jgi:hypothetical protein
MKRLASLACLVALPVAVIASSGPKAPGSLAKTQIDRGRYLVWAGGCNDCHTPKKMTPQGPVLDEAMLLAGHREQVALPPPPQPAGPWIASAYAELTAWSGPWGISYAVNLTPDENTGIGSWSEATFVKALKTGRHMGVSRPILPPMPIEAIRNYTDEDLKAMYAYLRSLPAIKNRVPEPVIAEPPAVPVAASR